MKVGDKVKVEFEGTVCATERKDRFMPGGFIPEGMDVGSDGDHCGFFEVRDESSNRHVIWNEGFYGNRRRAFTVIGSASPRNWPPRPGDVWESEGKLYGIQRSALVPSEYIVREIASGELKFVPRNHRGNSLAEFKALSPELVKRQGAS